MSIKKKTQNTTHVTRNRPGAYRRASNVELALHVWDLLFTEDIINELRLILNYSLHQACWKYCDHNLIFASVFNKVGQLSVIIWSIIFYKVVHHVMVPIRECLWWFHMLDSPPVPYSFSSSISDHLRDWRDCHIADLLLGTVFSINLHGLYCHLAHSHLAHSHSRSQTWRTLK